MREMTMREMMLLLMILRDHNQLIGIINENRDLMRPIDDTTVPEKMMMTTRERR